MNRDQAIKVAEASCWRVGDCAGLVDALVALGVLKLEEPTPKPAIQVALAGIVLQRRDSADASGWRIGLYGASMILNALDEAGYKIVLA
jgi:hypothetical protein